MISIFYSLLPLLLVVIFGCDNNDPESLMTAARKEAAKQEGLYRASKLYEDFTLKFPRHEFMPVVLKEWSAVLQQTGDMDGALGLYGRLLKQFPDSPYCDEAQFMTAFIYEDYLKDYDRAREAYRRVIESYPQSELVPSARHLLPNVGRNPEEWVQFEGSGE